MTGWDGRGLPPAASARLERFRASGLRTSMLSVADAACLDGVGLPFVGEVMGCMVQQITWTGTGTAAGLPRATTFVDGHPVTTARQMPTVTTSGGGGWHGYAPYVQALYTGYRTAISRMVAEATSIGAVGIVGVSVTRADVGNACTEFMAMGTAVGGDAGAGLGRPFVTDLSGADVSKALSSGWVPVSLAFGISVAVIGTGGQVWRQLLRQTRRWAGNVEVEVLSELAGKVRADARDQFKIDAARGVAEASIVSSMDLRMVHGDQGESRPFMAEAIVSGSTLARFGRGVAPPPHALTVLPLRQSARSKGSAP